MRYESDLLVLGGGMAGMTAAYWASTHGARVLVLEKAPEIGGSAVLSGAHLWTAQNVDVLREHCPNGDPDLGRAFLEGFRVAADFVRSSGVEITEQISVLYGEGYRFDIIEYLRRAKRSVEMNEGWVLPSRYVENLIQDDGGAVVGARVRDVEGFTEVSARGTILATGGFQANRALLQEYFGDRSAHLLLRSNSYSSGDGLRLGRSVGADIAAPMDAFYGHLIAWPINEFLPKDFSRLSMMFSVSAVLVNTEGRRFVDESLADHTSNQRVADQPTSRAVLVFDEEVRRTAAVAPVTKGFEAIDLVAEAIAARAHVATADTLDNLGDAIRAWGYDGATMVEEVRSYNAAIEAGSDPRPARKENRFPVSGAPFHALEVRPGITFTEGGLSIDGHGRVLDTSGVPIPGLYAAGGDTGGVFNGGYAGGLALGAAFGIRAATHALGASVGGLTAS